MSGHTPGPWAVWDGPAYVGGGRDLCIGAGDKWLANMDERECQRRMCHWDVCKLEDDSSIVSLGSDCDCSGVCTFEDHITDEQRANANLIVASPEMADAIRFVLFKHEHQYDVHGSECWICAKLRGPLAKAEGR